jgi:hypothetical protein
MQTAMLDYPPSLDLQILARSWRAGNGELGVNPADVNAFLEACDRDGIPVLGGELWLVDHLWDGGQRVECCPGTWTGLIPNDSGTTFVWSYEGNSRAAREQIGSINWQLDVRSDLHPFVRFNFTLDA